MRAVSGATISHFKNPPRKKKNRKPRMPAACSRSSSASVTFSSATAMPRESGPIIFIAAMVQLLSLP